MTRKLIASGAALLALVSTTALAEGSGLTLSTGFDYSSGKYGESQSTTSWTVPVQAKYETGRLSLKLSMPWVRTSGTANIETGLTLSDVRGCDSTRDQQERPADCAGGSTVVTTATSRTESGLGDLVASGFYNLIEPEGGVGLDVGLKVKFATADSDKCLLTTGANDYSVQADLYRTSNNLTPYVTLGWTRKGDPDARDAQCRLVGGKVNLRDPFYASVGVSYRLDDATSVGLVYDFREKLLSRSDPVSEASLSVTRKLGKSWRLQGYGLAGFSDASPDWGVGASVDYGF
jgi:hypothetical protein